MTLSSLIDTGAFFITAVWVAFSVIWPFVALAAAALWAWFSVLWWRRRRKFAAYLAAVVSLLPLIAGGSIVTDRYFYGFAILPSQWRVFAEPLLFLLPYILVWVAAALLLLRRRVVQGPGSNQPFQGTDEKLRSSIPSAASPLQWSLN